MSQDRDAATVATEAAGQKEPGAGDRAAEKAPGAQPPEGQVSEGQSQQEALDAALEEVASLREQHLRAAAEMENVRRRAARDVENAHRYGIERFAAELLSVADSMEMGLQSISEVESTGPVGEGFRATLKQLGQCLERFGITPIDPLGELFDPELHEAMTVQPAPDKTPGSVLTVIQKGYRIHDRLLRPARVIVVRGDDDAQS